MGFSNPKTFPRKLDKVCISKLMSTINIYRLRSKGFLYHEHITKGSITVSIKKIKIVGLANRGKVLYIKITGLINDLEEKSGRI